MAKVTLKLEGMDALQRAITAAPERLAAYAGDAVAKSAFAVAQRSKALAPFRTGTLRGAIASSTTGLNGRVGLSDKRAFYWRFVEFGTVRVPARPFFRPAAEAESEPFVQSMRSVGSKLERDLSSGRFV